MKTRFNTYDVVCAVSELQKCIGMRVNQVYDIDTKTYLIRLQRTEEKCIILIESGNRFHSTAFEWPKNMAPSGFAMKMRKHLKNKRLEKLTQLGVDRVVDFQFGMGEAAYHVILELYDRGNIILTDCDWTILNVLRPHTEGETIRFAVREKYPLDRAKESFKHPNEEETIAILNASKPGDNLKKILNPHLEYGPAIIDHVLSKNGLSGNLRLITDPKEKGFLIERDIPNLLQSFEMADKMMDFAKNSISKGYIIQKKEDRPTATEGPKFLLTNVEFHPFLFAQYENQPYKEFDSFDQSVDEFFSSMESQKIDLKAVHIEREAYKKLQNVKKDHEKRLTELEKTQIADKEKAELIMQNQQLVDSAILAVQTAIANQMPWADIKTLIKTAQGNKDPVALSIKQLKLESNNLSLILKDPYTTESDSESDDENIKKKKKKHEPKGIVIDIDLALTAYANARRYFSQKKTAARKQQKTVESHGKALKSAEKKTIQTLKEVQTITSINKARKMYWFEKFFWFISSENYLIIGGRDQQQNELLVKRYMKATDIYVHADLSGASSIIIKNPTGNPVPPKTLNEAGQMAVSYSVAWEAKVVASAWWVSASQVSKTAPTGEYLTTGSFMIRGKKNFLPPCHLILGFSFMFRLEESSIERHLNERKVVVLDDDLESIADSQVTENEDQEITVSDGEDDDDDKKSSLSTIVEQAQEISLEQNKTEPNDSESDDEYPDTHIKIEHDTGKIILKNTIRTTSMISSENGDEEDENVIYLGDDKPIVLNKNTDVKPKKEKSKKEKIEPQEKQENKKQDVDTAPVMKRGQKSKLKKMKEKYKHYDENDRIAFVALMKSAGTKKVDKKAAKNQPKKIPIQKPVPFVKKEKVETESQVEKTGNASDNEEQEPEPEAEVANVAADTDMLNQLTGSPVQEDELLFAVPIVAPYSALQNYKFKIKLTPGTGKRGKAAKTAVQVFLKDKQCSIREKDLLKAVKDENIARNLPGKVKLSAPQLQKHKK